ncbi:hypothetical protein CsSME_00002924 [Camellia sinensis var. sinensis]
MRVISQRFSCLSMESSEIEVIHQSDFEVHLNDLDQSQRFRSRNRNLDLSSYPFGFDSDRDSDLNDSDRSQ